MIKYVKGNLLDMMDSFDAVLHGCNAFCTMGAGVAFALASKYPQIAKADMEQTISGDRKKMGTYSKAMVGDTAVLNCYTQYYTGRNLKPFDYNAFKRVLKLVKQDFGGKRIGMPMIGAGLAGGDWNKISQIIEDELAGEDVTVVQL